LEKIYEAASLAGFRGKEVAEQQIELLSHENPVIRYWAILGLRSQKPEILKPLSEKILEAMEDEYPPVAVLASAIGYGMFSNKTAEENLKKFCSHENLDISLMAVYSLLYFEPDQRKPFVETVWKVREMDDRNYNVRAACMDVLGSLGLVPNNPDYRE
jgi:HEAT repeat protein